VPTSGTFSACAGGSVRHPASQEKAAGAAPVRDRRHRRRSAGSVRTEAASPTRHAHWCGIDGDHQRVIAAIVTPRAVFAFNPDPLDVACQCPFLCLWRPGRAFGDDRRGPDRPDTSAFLEQRRPIKEIVRTLSVSRATVRKVVRGQGRSSSTSAACSGRRRLGEWSSPDGVLEAEATCRSGSGADPGGCSGVARPRYDAPTTVSSVRKDGGRNERGSGAMLMCR